MSPGVSWSCLPFAELSPLTLYRILRARQAVFVVEQRCIFLDADALDERCWHLAGWLAEATTPSSSAAAGAPTIGPGVLVASARIVPPGLRYAEASIGRVLTIGAGRGVGLGDRLMQRALAEVQTHWPGRGVRLSAQARLAPWYERLGFVVEGDPYDEDGIAHLSMLRAGST